MKQKITPFLWFDGKAEEAAAFYTSLFDDSRILKVTRYTEAGPGPAATVMTVNFELHGQPFIALNGGPHFTFSPAISFMVNCETQEEIDRLWDRLCEGGEEVECGWLKDRYGLSWQIVPAALSELMNPAEPERSERVLQALLKMKKLDLAALRLAYDGA